MTDNINIDLDIDSDEELGGFIKRKRKARNKIIGLVVIVAFVVWGAWKYTRTDELGMTEEPLVAVAEISSIENTISAAGSLKPSNYVDVGAQVSGQLQKLHVEVGDVVEEGQLLAEIDARVQESRVEASRANIEAQEAQLDARRASLALAKSNAERQERLRAVNATSQLDYDNALNNLASAESSLIQLEKQIEQSLASLNQEETQLEFTKIFAPTAGTVVSIEMNEGRTLNATQQAPTILRIADLNIMTVETEISEADIASIKKGMTVYFTTLGGGDRRWYSSLRQVLPTPTVTSNVVLYTGLFDIDNNDETLLPEMTAQVYFVTSSAENVLTVPLGALSFNDAVPSGMPGMAVMAGASGGEMPEIPAEMRERFEEMRASGAFPGGGQAGGFARSSRSTSSDGPRMATVTVIKADGTREEREVMVGVTSRVAAEILSGLKVGDEVVAGILQSGSEAESSGNDDFRPPGGMMMRF